MKALTLATLNIHNDPKRWEERRDMIAAEMRRLSPDLIALQEVRLPENPAQWLADQLGGYSVFLTPKASKKADKAKEGIAILSRLPVETAEWRALGTQQRVAQFVKVQAGHKPFLFVNGHFYWHPGEHGRRLQQFQVLNQWLAKRLEEYPHAGLAICGDFNGTPESRSLKEMYRLYRSAFAAANGQEPDYTCPTPLQISKNIARKAAFHMYSLVKDKKREQWRGCIDYIFVNPNTEVLGATVAFDQPAPHDPTLWPSDHLGLAAQVRVA